MSAPDGRGGTAAQADHNHKEGETGRQAGPVEEKPIDLFGCMAGTAKICGDIIGPIEDAGWTGDEKTSELQPLLLDTHFWLWLVRGGVRLSSTARR